MPWKLRKAPKKDLYWVVNKETGKKHSKDPLPKETAKAQMKALYASENEVGGSKSSGFIKLMIAEKKLGRNPNSYTPPAKPKSTPAQFDNDLIQNPSKHIKEEMYEESGRIRTAMDKMRNIKSKNIVRSAVKKYVMAFKDRAIGAVKEITTDELADFLNSYERDGVEGIVYSSYPITGELMWLHLLKKYKNDCYVLSKSGKNKNHYIPGIRVSGKGVLTEGSLTELAATFKGCLESNSSLIIIPLGLPSHQNMLIYRPTMNTIERFEPHGEYSGSKEESDKIDENLKAFFTKKSFNSIFKRTGVPEFKYLKPQDLRKGDGFQTLENKEGWAYQRANNIKLNYSGFCQMWSYFYLELCMKFPNREGADLIDAATEKLSSKGGTANFLKHIGAYVESSEAELKKLLNTFEFERIKTSNDGKEPIGLTSAVWEYTIWFNKQVKEILLEKERKKYGITSGEETEQPKPKVDVKEQIKKLKEELKKAREELKRINKQYDDIQYARGEGYLKAQRKKAATEDIKEEIEALKEEIKKLEEQLVGSGLMCSCKGEGTHRENVLEKFNLEEGKSLAELSKATGIPKKTLQQVYNRGIGAYKTNPTSVRMKGSFKKNVNAPMSKKLSKEQWAMARVYSFINNNPKHDADLRGGVSIPKADFIKEHERLIQILSKGTKAQRSLEAKDQSKELGKVGGAISKNDLQQMAESAYSGKTRLNIGSYKLVFSTPTLKFYKDDKNIVVSIRGTAEANDWQANTLAVIGQLKTSNRYKKDLNTLLDFQKKYPKTTYHYIGVAHSLGAAILDGFIRAGLLRNGMSYNGLVEPQELRGNPLHKRIYHNKDPLYLAIGKYMPNVEVRGDKGSFLELFTHSLPFGLGDLFTMYDRHRLKTFQGGC
nr:MAG: hypothetical protein [Lake Baikal virophage 11]